MPSQLNDSSGSGFYGKGYWSRKIFWLNVPTQWRHFDEFDYLQRLLNTWGDLGEDLLHHIYLLPLQRSPYDVRTKGTWTRWFYVTESFVYEDEERGQVVRLVGEKDFNEMPETDEENPPSADSGVLDELYPWFPYEPLAEVGRWWQLYWQDAQYEVINVRARNYDQPEIYDEETSLANEVWVQGGDLTLLFDYISNRQWNIRVEDDGLLGTVTIGQSDGSQRPVVLMPVSPVRLRSRWSPPDPVSMLEVDATFIVRVPLQGGGYRYLFDVPTDENTGTLNSGDGTDILATVCGTIDYLSGNITIDLEPLSEFSLRTGAGEYDKDIRVKYNVRGYFLLFNAPPTIGYLAQDFGFQNDQNDPEAVQRSSIANVTKFLGLKSTWDSYRIRGEISLFDVNMLGLYKICDPGLASSIPSGSVYTIGGELYTDIRPLYVKYDHIAPDEQFWDQHYLAPPDPGYPGTPEWVTVIDNILIALDPGRWDGMTIGQAFAVDVTQGYWADISPFNTVKRGPAMVTSVTAMNATELEDRRWEGGYKYEIQMRRCQFEAFNMGLTVENLQSPEIFALSIYDYDIAGPEFGTPPAPDDEYFYIDEQIVTWSLDSSPSADPKEDIGTWTVAIRVAQGVASPLSVDDDVAVRYVPTFDSLSCCYCRSNRMRALVDVTEEAYDFYTDPEKIDHAITRLKTKLNTLVPIHGGVIQWVITRRVEDEMYGAQNGAIVEHELDGFRFTNNIQVLLTVEIRGDINTAGKAIDLEIESEDTGVVWSGTFQTSASDNETWEEVVTDVEIALPADLGPGDVPWEVWTRASASASSAYGDVRWTLKITKTE